MECVYCSKNFKRAKLLQNHISKCIPIWKIKSQKSFKCPKCNKEFTRKYACDLHITNRYCEKKEKMACFYCSRTFKSPKLIENHISKCVKNPSQEFFKCPECKKEFTRKQSFDLHITNKYCQKESNKQCLIEECKFRYMTKTSLIQHLKDVHTMKIEPQEDLIFETWEDFVQWKQQKEEQTMTYYSQQCGENKGHIYYYCQRDGSSKSHVKSNPDVTRARRKPFLKGRVKTGTVCISMMKVYKNISGSVNVSYFSSHSHSINKNDLKHQPISADTNNFINHQLCRGVSPKEIESRLKENKFCRSNATVDCSRNDFINLKALRERKRRLCITILSPPDDTPDIEYNPVLSFQTDIDPSDSSMPTISDLLSIPSSIETYDEKSENCNTDILQMNTKLMDYIKNDKIPQVLLPLVKEVLSKLIAECESFHEPNSRD